MIPHEFFKIKNILDSFLGESKRGLSDSLQLEYPCPRCRESYGTKEDNKFNLSVSLRIMKFNCWKCSTEHDDMHGSVYKLIKMYGNDSLLKEYTEQLSSLRTSELYKLGVEKGEYNIEIFHSEDDSLKLPSNYQKFNANKYNNKKALEYLRKRNIGWDIIEEYNIGYTVYDENNKQASSRIIIPSFNEFGELNYWVGRDFTFLDKRQKYFNPTVERKSIIFNEEKIQWDADITLVEGPFDHLVVPNSIPLLGKVLKTDFKLFQTLNSKANANINIFLDGDAFDAVLSIYKILNHNRLYDKIRYIPVQKDMDPSQLYEIGGHKLINQHLKNSYQIEEIYLR